MLCIWDLNAWDVILYQYITGWCSVSGTVKIIEKHRNAAYTLIETDWSFWWEDTNIWNGHYLYVLNWDTNFRLIDSFISI